MAPIPDSATKGNPNDTLTIVGYGGFGGSTGSGSPFVMKLETFCRLAEIPYEVEISHDVRKSPKGTFPFIKHGDVVLADTEFILDYLTNTYDVKVKPCADRKLRGTAVAVKRLCEHHLDYGIMYYLMTTPPGWKLVCPAFFSSIPIPWRWIVINRVKKNVHDTLHKQGFGRHSEPDVRKLLDASLCAISDILGKNEYIIGEEPCPEDAAVFGCLDNYHQPQNEGLTTAELIQKYPNLVVYVENMRRKYFPEINPSKFA
ncbi:hypothetical protein BSKO_08957 [Bryopsis sp. KO-2023]|nr:hypothetical protein BSKO_08957 [Bryopsis sp. KO-2023]